jgi:hypothetical protein
LILIMSVAISQHNEILRFLFVYTPRVKPGILAIIFVSVPTAHFWP